MYGNYDGQSKPPEFDLHLGVNVWDAIQLNNSAGIVVKEILYVPPSDDIQVCLVNTGQGTPFISTLELRNLPNSTYVTPYQALVLFHRLDFGSKENQSVSDAVYDRLWMPSNSMSWNVLSTSFAIDYDYHYASVYLPGYVVMSTAISHANSSSHLEVYWEPTDTNAQHFVYLHIAEVEELLANETREFNILQNGQLFYGPFVPTYLYTQTLYSAQPVSGYSIHYLLERTNRSTPPPILNAMEIFEGKDFPQSPTLQQDVDAIMGIKSEYGVKRNWQGDPCVPKDYLWDSLNCTYAGYSPPTIIFLDLSSSGLSGEIPSYLSNLTKLQFLDLSNNSLSGEVPEFLSQLPQLKVLNLEVNSLSGSVPAELMERSHNGSLSLSLGGNPELCLSTSCQKKKKNKFVVPLAASVGTLFVVIIAVASVWFLNQRPQQESGTHITTVVAGTFGYLDPEYQKTSRLNEKSNVYSFGVVLLEIVTGRPVIDKSQDDNENFIHISQWVTSKVAEGDIMRIIDPSLGQELDKNCAWKVVESALSCASQDPENRPTMSEVVSDLKQCLVQKRKGPGNKASTSRVTVNMDMESTPQPK